jgi:hypothetical protein
MYTKMFVDVNENFRRFVNFSSCTLDLSGTTMICSFWGALNTPAGFSWKAGFAAFSTIDVPESDWITQYSEKK